MNVSNNPPSGGLPFNEHLEESPTSPSSQTPSSITPEVRQTVSPETIHGSASTGASNYWSLKWPDLRACTSTIRSITSACIGSLLRTIKWAFYSCAVSSSKRSQANDSEELTQATSELNQVDYHEESIQVSDREDGCSFPIPLSGSFKAGKDLRSQFAAYLFEKIVGQTTKIESGEAEGITQARLDIPRCTAFTIIDEKEQKESIWPSASEGAVDQETKVNNGIAKITQLVGGEGPLATAILSLTNQTAGNACYRLYSNSNENLRTDGAIGFPATFRELKYTLKKEETSGSEYYLFHFEGGSLTKTTFNFKKTAQEIQEEQANLKKETIEGLKYKKADNAEKEQLIQDDLKTVRNIRELAVDEKLKMTSVTSLSIKITPNARFDETREMDSNNFPCTLEVVELTNTYTTALSRGEGQRYFSWFRTNKSTPNRTSSASA